MPAVLRLPRLDLPVHLGVTAEERQTAQVVQVTVELTFADLPGGIRTDRLEDTVDYAALAGRLRDATATPPFQLIERLAAILLAETAEATAGKVDRIRITVAKFPPVEGLVGGATFTLDSADFESSR